MKSYYTYILKSEKNGDIYIGSTGDINQRFALHNAGRVKSTKGYRLWKLLESYAFSSRSEAVYHEKFFKSHQ